MREVGVAFPNDETTAEVIASRLRAEGIPVRVDRGLWGSGQQVGMRGHITVLVREEDAARAHDALGTTPREEREPGTMFWLMIAFMALVLLFAIVAVVMTLI